MEDFTVGQKVHYTAPHGKTENGIVKEVREVGCFVVYHCNEDWEHYQDYIGQLTHKANLKNGWI